MRTLMLLSLLLTISVSTGCNISNGMKWSKFRSNVFNESRHMDFDESIDPETIPDRMAVIWHDATATQTGAVPTRGFGGRIYFYNFEDKPIEVEGELVIYGYDDTDSDRRKSAPDKKFVFEDHELKRHVGESDLGTSYNIWIPWDKVGGVRKNIGLVAVFKGNNGGIVKGGHSVNVLPGLPKEKKNEFAQYSKNSDGLHLAYTGFDTPANNRINTGLSDEMSNGEIGQVNYRRAIVPTTIPIPRETQRRIDSMRDDLKNSEVIRKIQQEQAKKMVEQLKTSGASSTEVVYGKQDVSKLLERKSTSNQSFVPGGTMMNQVQATGADQTGASGSNAQVIPTAVQSKMVPQNHLGAGIQQTSASIHQEYGNSFPVSTQSNAQPPEARRVFGRPGSFR